MAKQITAEEAKAKAAGMCSLAEKCVHDISEKLKKWNISEEEAVHIISFLLKEKFIDEKRYARFFVQDKHKFAKWGKTKIAFALKNKGIAQSDINEALSQIEDDNYQEQIEALLQNKLKTIKYKDKYDARAKLFRFGASRGFEPNILTKIIEKIEI
ncbi:MAG: RecX family transcriptional regulator [Paludibacteraceae bacterium]|nr:RecX family transcriptional regulator [Paludibacteraceae bacterium]